MDSDKLGQRESAGVSRRALPKTGAVTGAAAGVAAAGSLARAGTADAATRPAAAGGQRTTPGEDLILRNGRIHTMDGSSTVASVIAIRGGFVAYVGNSIGAAKQQFASQPRIIDLNGAMAVPGLIDCHNHFVLMGNRPGHHTPLENAGSIADVQALYAARARTLPTSPNPPVSADNFITTIGGFSPNQFKEVRLPTLAELDAAVPHQPVFIQVGFTGPAVTNSLGRAFFENVTGPYPVTVGADGSIAASPFEGNGPTTAALLALRKTLSLDQINPGQHLTRTEVLEHFTSANRWFLGGTDEDLLGTLEVGRLGDVVVLSDDYFTVADEDLKKLHSVLTVLGGRVVHFGGVQYWA